MNIVFMGTPDYATIIFRELLEQNYNIIALFTQMDKKVGRRQVLTPPHIKQFVLDNGLSLPIYQPQNLKDKASYEILAKLKPDMIIVAAYGQILPKSILDIAPCINLHASLLPKYRGASPIQEAILNDDKYTGVTAMLMEEGLDSGDILGYKYLKLTSSMEVQDAFNKLSILAAKLTIEVLKRFDNIKPTKQNNSKVSYCGKITKNDGIVDFSNAKQLYQKYKAYKFWPGIFLESKLKIIECTLNEIDSINEMGIILEIQKEYIVVGCLKGSIKITQLQAPSKKAILATDYIRGQRLEIGNYLS